MAYPSVDFALISTHFRRDVVLKDGGERCGAGDRGYPAGKLGVPT